MTFVVWAEYRDAADVVWGITELGLVLGEEET
jgi:hypothetical protein